MLCIVHREGNEAFVDDDYELAVKVGSGLFFSNSVLETLTFRKIEIKVENIKVRVD